MTATPSGPASVPSPRPTRSGRPPGPRGHWLLGSGPANQSDPLGMYLDAHRAYGDVVRFRALPPFAWYLVAHPDDVEHVLVKNQRNYAKGSFFANALTPLLGHGLLTSEGEHWRRQRRLVQPAFHRQQIAALGETIAEAVAAMVGRWDAHVRADGGPLDLLTEATRLALDVAGPALFGADVGRRAAPIARATRIVLEDANYRLNTPFAPAVWLPTRQNRRFRRARAVLDRVVFDIIGQRRREGGEHHDLLGMLMAARDEETGAAMTDAELRDEVVTLLIGGHETTAAALAWSWFLLGKHPDAAARLEAEADATLPGGGMPTITDLERLPYGHLVWQEALRLYPPAWGVPRQAIAPDVVGGYLLPAGAILNVAAWVTHRHAEFWDAPERFDPERFTSARADGRHRFAYLPFGAGARQCVGAGLANAEGRLTLSAVARRFHVRLVPGHPVEPDPTFALRPRHGVLATLEPR